MKCVYSFLSLLSLFCVASFQEMVAYLGEMPSSLQSHILMEVGASADPDPSKDKNQENTESLEASNKVISHFWSGPNVGSIENKSPASIDPKAENNSSDSGLQAMRASMRYSQGAGVGYNHSYATLEGFFLLSAAMSLGVLF